jgi:hypothetical protein
MAFVGAFALSESESECVDGGTGLGIGAVVRASCSRGVGGTELSGSCVCNVCAYVLMCVCVT